MAAFAGKVLVDSNATVDLSDPLQAFGKAMVVDPVHADIEGMLAEGYSQDGVLELALSAAVGAGAERLRIALDAIGGRK